jgi:enoyl-CoA hydratase/carnithine racemase
VEPRTAEPLAVDELAERAGSVLGRAWLLERGPAITVALGSAAAPLPEALAALPLVLIGVGDPTSAACAAVDTVVPDVDEAAALLDAANRRPRAAVALALLLRAAERRSVGEGLVAESATYSTLQAGPEHQAWLSARRRRPRPGLADPIRVVREEDVLRVQLARPQVRNALDAAMRDALLDVVAVVEADPSLRLELGGDGPVFCSGGDLDEFGTLDDPASAHRLRLARSLGLALAGLADRTTVRVHGACAGSGVELAAFAGRVQAAPGCSFALPELDLGLIPGAGGTVSLTRRIGRHRTAWMALSGARIDAATALEWGLVDALGAAAAPTSADGE